MHRASVFVDRWEAEAELFRYIAGWYNASRIIFHAGGRRGEPAIDRRCGWIASTMSRRWCSPGATYRGRAARTEWRRLQQCPLDVGGIGGIAAGPDPCHGPIGDRVQGGQVILLIMIQVRCQDHQEKPYPARLRRAKSDLQEHLSRIVSGSREDADRGGGQPDRVATMASNCPEASAICCQSRDSTSSLQDRLHKTLLHNVLCSKSQSRAAGDVNHRGADAQ